MAALAPSISQALSAQAGPSWMDICSATDTRWAQPDGAAGEPAPVTGGAHTFEHCPYCALQAHQPVLPSTALALPLAPSASHLLPSAFLAAPRTLHAWVSAQPRAPPLPA